MATTIIETIGPGEDWANIPAWLTAHNGDDLVALDERHIGQIVPDELAIVPGGMIVPDVAGGGCTTNSECYRRLQMDPTPQPRYRFWSNIGARLYGQWNAGTADQTLITINEDNFQMGGVGVICEDPYRTSGAASNTKVAPRLYVL